MLATVAIASLAIQSPSPSGSPLMNLRPDPASPGWIVSASPGAIERATKLDHWHIQGFPLGGQLQADLTLDRQAWERNRPALHLDGQPAPGLLESLDLTLWTGTVAGSPNSDVVLWFSNHGINGWIHDGSELYHFIGRPAGAGDWSRQEVLILAESDLSGMLDMACDSSAIAFQQAQASLPGIPAQGGLPGVCALLECKVALECDTQFAGLFNNNGAAAASYVTALWAAISLRYESQINTVLTFPYLNIPTNGVDPWQTQDNPGATAAAVLVEFRNAWANNLPNGAKTAMMMSGASIGGGVGYLGILCNPSFAFAVSGNLSGNCPFPVSQGPSNWDFFINAHELGHNFNAPHTHDTCPPLDQCAPTANFGPCQNSQVCSSQGTIMSYCHQCAGGVSNISPNFHPAIQDIMRTHAGSCLPGFIEATASAPSLLSPGQPTPVQLIINVPPPSPPIIRFAEDASNYVTVPMVDQGGGVYSGSLPAAACGTAPRYYYSITDPNCGNRTLPDGAPGVTYQASAGSFAVVASDNFEAPSGWTSGAPGDTATAGLWERVDPNPNGSQPGDDHSQPGSICWVTEQHAVGSPNGTSDVDGGVTTLLSPIYDLTGYVDPVVSYWRWFSNDQGSNPNQDVFRIQVSNNGGNTWTTMETVGPATENSGGWIQASLSVSSYVTPTAFVRFRFRAEDSGGASIVEAAIDDFQLNDLDCSVGIGSSYCSPAVPNSTGQGAVISATGSISALDNNLQLTVTGLPFGQFSYFNASLSSAQIAQPGGSQGVLCLGAPVARFRFNILISNGGQVNFQPNLNQIPLPPSFQYAVQPGESWHWQLWFRDNNPGPTSNFSDALLTTFQ